MHLPVDSHTWTYIPVLLFSFGYVCQYGYSVIYVFCIGINTRSCVLLFIFTLSYTSLCFHSPLLNYTHVDVHTSSCIDVLILTFVHTGHYCSSHLFICTHVDTDTCSCIPVLIIILGYILMQDISYPFTLSSERPMIRGER